MIRRPPRSTPLYSSAASDVYKRQPLRPAWSQWPDSEPFIGKHGSSLVRVVLHLQELGRRLVVQLHRTRHLGAHPLPSQFRADLAEGPPGFGLQDVLAGPQPAPPTERCSPATVL